MILFFRDNVLFGFGTTISLDVKTYSVPQFIGASQHSFEITDLGIELLVPLALNRQVNSSDTLILTAKSLHCPRPPRTEEPPMFEATMC